MAIPIFQPFIKCQEHPKEMIALQKELFDLARNGDLLIEYQAFVALLSSKLSLPGKIVVNLNFFRVRMRRVN